MSHTDKAFIKAFRPGRPSRTEAARTEAARTEAARVETHQVETARIESARAPSVRAEPESADVRPEASDAVAAAFEVSALAPEAEPCVSATLPAIEREPSEAPDTPLLTADEIALLRGALGALPEVAEDRKAVPVPESPVPSASSEGRTDPAAVEPPAAVASSAARPPVAMPPVPVPEVAAPITTAASAGAASTPAEPAAKPTPADPAAKPAVGGTGLRGLRLRTLADFTEDRGGEDAGWTVRNRVRKFEVSGVCGTLLKQRQAEFAGLVESLKVRMQDGLKTLWVASCRGNEGASTFVVCLAAAVAATGAKVVAVDHDLTNPGLSDLLHLQPEKGWREVLLGDIPLTDGLWQSDEGWAALPLRTDHAAPLSGSHLPRLRLNMAMLRREYDLVLLDAGPLRLAGDDELAYPQPDAALLVRDPQSTSTEDLHRHVERLATRRLELLGVVENFVHDAEPALT